MVIETYEDNRNYVLAIFGDKDLTSKDNITSLLIRYSFTEFLLLDITNKQIKSYINFVEILDMIGELSGKIMINTPKEFHNVKNDLNAKMILSMYTSVPIVKSDDLLTGVDNFTNNMFDKLESRINQGDVKLFISEMLELRKYEKYLNELSTVMCGDHYGVNTIVAGDICEPLRVSRQSKLRSLLPSGLTAKVTPYGNPKERRKVRGDKIHVRKY